jgi:class 3 adenylate cyclase
LIWVTSLLITVNLSMPIERKLAAIMFTDIAGYTALSAKDETKALKLLDTQKEILTPIIKEFNGTLHKEIGDGLLFTFPTVSEAVKCGIKIQAQTKSSEGLNLRIGIHEGEVTLKDNDVLGDDVNVASRIEPFSAIGGIAVSGKVQQNISSLTEFETKYIGKPKLKGVSQEVKVYCISSHGLPQTDLSKVSAKLEKESSFNIFALTGGLLTLIGISFWIAISIFDLSFADENEVPSIGILMMENLGKADEAFWSSRMTADLITKVTGAGLIRVSSLSDILKIDDGLSLEDKASVLRVRYILSHQFLINDDGFDLWCTLEDTKSGIALFSNKISEPMDMTNQIVGKLANDIIKSLKITTSHNLMEVYTKNIDAYEYFLRGYHKLDNVKNNDDLYIARDLFIDAIELDHSFIAAKNAIAEINYMIDNNSEKAMNAFRNNFDEAQSNDDKDAMAACLNAMGIIEKEKIALTPSEEYPDSIHYHVDKDFSVSIAFYKRAAELANEIGNDHGKEVALNNIAMTYITQEDYHSALFYMKLSLKSPLSIQEIEQQNWKLKTISMLSFECEEYLNALYYYLKYYTNS